MQLGEDCTCKCHDHVIVLILIHQWVASVDLFANEAADANLIVTPTDSWTQQGTEVGICCGDP